MYHVTDARAFDRICDQGLRAVSDAHSEHVYLFDDLDAALSFAERYHFAGQVLGNGAWITPATKPLLLLVDGAGLDLEPDPMRPSLPHSYRTTELIEPERLIASAQLAYDGKVHVARPRRII